MEHAYHVRVRIEGERICISSLIGDPVQCGSPTTTLAFQPVQSDPALYPITIHWQSEIPQRSQQQAAVEHAVLAYCGRLLGETAYQGPIDCCL